MRYAAAESPGMSSSMPRRWRTGRRARTRPRPAPSGAVMPPHTNRGPSVAGDPLPSRRTQAGRQMGASKEWPAKASGSAWDDDASRRTSSPRHTRAGRGRVAGPVANQQPGQSSPPPPRTAPPNWYCVYLSAHSPIYLLARKSSIAEMEMRSGKVLGHVQDLSGEIDARGAGASGGFAVEREDSGSHVDARAHSAQGG